MYISLTTAIVSTLVFLWALIGSAQAHEPYSDLRNQKNELCCSGKDCKPSSLCLLPSGTPGVMLAGECRPYDVEQLGPTPDGDVHVCHAPGKPTVPRCVLIPGET